jgi:transcriptional regulator with XRE-family HTH domain
MDIDIKFSLAGFLAKGLTQAQIGAEIGCTQSVVSEMASGKCGTTRPSYQIVKGIADLAAKLGVPTAPPAKKSRRAAHNVAPR